MRYVLLLIFLSLSTPVLVSAVSLSEVAWMGSPTSANHEWIELYNPGEAVSVEGWTLRDGMNLTIVLSGTIPAASYVILERNRGDSGSVAGTPFLSYSGALVNTGATLTLRRADESVVDQVVGGENWQSIGGDNTTKETAQYTSSGWITAAPTPGRANATVGSTSPNTPPPSAPSSPAVRASSQTILTGSPTSAASTRANYGHLPWELSLQITGPDTAQVNQPVTFQAAATGLGPVHLNSLVHSWNFGDLTTGNGERLTHTFSYPGTYLVTLHATYAKHEAIATKRVTVLPVQFSLARVASGDLQLYNDASYEVDISGFILTSDGKSIVFPLRSYLTERSSLTIPASRIGTAPVVTLHTQSGLLIASTVGSQGREVGSGAIRTPAPAGIRHVQNTVPAPVSVEPALSEAAAFGFVSVAATNDAIEEVMLLSTTATTGISSSGAGLISGRRTEAVPDSPDQTHWTYGLLILLLAGAVATLLLLPPAASKKE